MQARFTTDSSQTLGNQVVHGLGKWQAKLPDGKSRSDWPFIIYLTTPVLPREPRTSSTWCRLELVRNKPMPSWCYLSFKTSLREQHFISKLLFLARSSCCKSNTFRHERWRTRTHFVSRGKKQLKNGLLEMVSTFSIPKFRLEILDYLSKHSVRFENFPFGRGKIDCFIIYIQQRFSEFLFLYGFYYLFAVFLS